MHRLAILPVLSTLLCTACQREAVPGTPSAATPFPYAETSITELAARMGAGELDSTTLTRAYLDRIASIDRTGPTLRSILELNPDALKEAARLDDERRSGRLRGPLHGIPVLAQGQHRRHPHEQHRRLTGTGRLQAGH